MVVFPDPLDTVNLAVSIMHYSWLDPSLAALNESLYLRDPHSAKSPPAPWRAEDFHVRTWWWHQVWKLIKTVFIWKNLSLTKSGDKTQRKRVGYVLSLGNHTVMSSSLSPPHNVVCGLWAHGFNDGALVRHQKARGKLAACNYRGCSDQKPHSGLIASWTHLGWGRTVEWKGSTTLHDKL